MEKRLFLVASAVEDGRPRWWTQAGWVPDFSDAAVVPESRRDRLKEAEERALAEGRLLNPEILRVARRHASPNTNPTPEPSEVGPWTGVELRARARLGGPTVGPAQGSRETGGTA